jgi:putative transposase
MQWSALNATGICSSSSAQRRFQEWEQAGVFHEIWRQGLLDYDEVVGIDWAWLLCDGATGKAPLGGQATGPNPLIEHEGGETFALCEAAGVPIGLAHEGANCHDSKLLAPTLDTVPIARPEPSAEQPQTLCLDGGYGYPWVEELAAGRGYTARIRRRSDELELKRTTPGWRARRCSIRWRCARVLRVCGGRRSLGPRGRARRS